MRLRLRLQHRRIQVSIVRSHRVDGRVKEDHVASLGSVPPKMSVNDRATFWDAVEPRLARLGNRLGQEGYAKIAKELRAKVPVVTAAERKAEARAKFESTVAIVKKIGLTETDIAHAVQLARLSDAEFQEVVAETVRGTLRGYEQASRAATSKILKRRRMAPLTSS
jgi:hypothetical protein